MFRFVLTIAVMTALAGCIATSGGLSDADLSSGLIPASGDNPPSGPEGACWARDVTPAVIETEIEQVMVAPATEGSAATFRSTTRQKIVQDRRDVWFRTPCEAEMTVPFVASVQRALKARGLYRAPVTGEMDAATRLAIRQFQEPRGLDSEVLSLGAAQALGISATDIDRL